MTTGRGYREGQCHAVATGTARDVVAHPLMYSLTFGVCRMTTPVILFDVSRQFWTRNASQCDLVGH